MAYEDLFPSAFADAVDIIYTRGEQHPDAQQFVDHTFINLIAKPGDLARAAVLSPGGAEIPAPAFHGGQRAQVVVDDRNRTPHCGSVRGKVWHFRDQ
ncbi:hypothetical protein [Streptomyces sp. NPDC030920]|uniref:hypothetical protein n=1 Tax=Streptomyces sp. NPDC030920 TaxID=3365308 RepID=UPI00384E4D1B